MTYYDSPINLAVSEASKIEQDIANDCIRIATKYSIDIDEKKLIEAITADHERYEEAYRHGYEDGKKAEMERNFLSRTMPMEDCCEM